MSDATNQWEIVPQGLISWSYDLKVGDTMVAALRSSYWNCGCNFTMADCPFAIRRVWHGKEQFLLFAGDEAVGEAKRKFGLRRFEISSAGAKWLLKPAGWFTRAFQLVAGDCVAGTIRPTSWYSRHRVAEFAKVVPPPIQVLAIFLVLVISQRQNRYPVGS